MCIFWVKRYISNRSKVSWDYKMIRTKAENTPPNSLACWYDSGRIARSLTDTSRYGTDCWHRNDRVASESESGITHWSRKTHESRYTSRIPNRYFSWHQCRWVLYDSLNTENKPDNRMEGWENLSLLYGRYFISIAPVLYRSTKDIGYRWSCWSL